MPRPGHERRGRSPHSRKPLEPASGARAPHDQPGAVRRLAMSRTDWTRLSLLPWGRLLAEWPKLNVATLSVRHGDSRHPVLFVEAGRRRYAIKETSPLAAEHEIDALVELRRRGCHTLEPVGIIVATGEPVLAGAVAGHAVYESGDTGYCVTRLAEHVLPQSLLYRYPFTDGNKRLLWNAVAELLLALHEAGVFWGDPSLANVLIDLSGQRLVAVMADAETARIVPGPLDEGARRQDLGAFVESLAWQAEDIRIARGLPEEQRLVTEGDAAYFLSRYVGLRAERQRAAGAPARAEGAFAGIIELERRARRLNALGYGAVRLGRRALHAGISRAGALVETGYPRAEVEVATVRPGWYTRRLHDLLGVRVPRKQAQRIFHHLNVHKWLLSERAGYDVGMETAARDWRTRVHAPLLGFLETYLPGADTATLYAEYAAILDHTWEMSVARRMAVPVEEGAMDYALAAARTRAPDAPRHMGPAPDP
jgi:uncharacterized protein DUF4032